MNLKYFMFLFFLTLTSNADAEIVINELMQSNVYCLMDDMNDFPDSWVELYNTERHAISLKDYRLGLKHDASQAWQLPEVEIGSLGHLVVYCDKVGSGLHTNFRLESGKGGEVYLFHHDIIVDEVTGLKKQPSPDIAYGRIVDGSDEWGYQAKPTPGIANCGQICEHILNEPIFSEEGRIMKQGERIFLTLAVPEECPEGTKIRYTTDGSEPTSNSSLFEEPLVLTADATIRARLFCNGWLSPCSTTHSYLFLPREQTLPVISLVTSGAFLNDSKIGIYVTGSFDKAKKNYEYNWRRPANFEFFNIDGEDVINQLTEIRIMGGASRVRPLKSLIVYANKRFGKKRLSYEFFPDQKPELTEFKSISLRNAGNDFDHLYMRDAIIQRTMGQHTDLDWQAWRPAILYMNGKYMGIINIRERSDEDNVYTNYNGLEDIDMVENWTVLKEGTIDNFEQFKLFYSQNGHSLEEYARWLDWKEFINLMVMNLYFHNQDFPANNIVMWRPRNDDGHWRFIAKDTDFGLGIWNAPSSYNTIEWLYTPGYDPKRNSGNAAFATLLFRQMMDDSVFRREFIDRAAVYMGDFLNEQGVWQIWEPMYNEVRCELPYHLAKYGYSLSSYDREVESTRKWLRERTGIFYRMLSDFYHLGMPVPMKIKAEDNTVNDIDLNFNGISLSKGLFDGMFFEGRDIVLSAVAPSDYIVTGWRVCQENRGSVISKEISGNVLRMKVPQCSSLSVTVMTDNHNQGISSSDSSQWKWSVRNGYLIISGVTSGVSIVLYDLHGVQQYRAIADGGETSIPIRKNQGYVIKVGEQTKKVFPR
jgi:hypothetical protein